MSDVVTMWEMDYEYGAKHYDNDADGSNAEQRAEQDGEASGELG